MSKGRSEKREEPLQQELCLGEEDENTSVPITWKHEIFRWQLLDLQQWEDRFGLWKINIIKIWTDKKLEKAHFSYQWPSEKCKNAAKQKLLITVSATKKVGRLILDDEISGNEWTLNQRAKERVGVWKWVRAHFLSTASHSWKNQVYFSFTTTTAK